MQNNSFESSSNKNSYYNNTDLFDSISKVFKKFQRIGKLHRNGSMFY